MAELITVARPYAEAVFRLAQEQKQLDVWGADLATLSCVAGEPGVADVCAHPKSSAVQLQALFLSPWKNSASAELQNFVTLLIKNKRLVLLPEIARQFDALVSEVKNESVAEVTSAFALDTKQTKTLADGLSSRYGRTVRVDVKVDPALLGGIKIAIGDEVIDASVQGRLQAMAAALTV